MKGKLLTFLLGIVLGGAATIVLPRFVGPLLPAGLMSDAAAVEGTVVKRQRDEDRLLLTINTAQGAALATFTEKVAEIDLLVEEGDSITLALSDYEPFVDNPPIRAVRKAEPGPAAESPAASTAPDSGDPDAAPVVGVPAGLPSGASPAPAAGDPDAAPVLGVPVGEPAVEAEPAGAELEEYPGDGGGDG